MAHEKYPRFTSSEGKPIDFDPRAVPFLKEPNEFLQSGTPQKEEMEIYLHYDVFKALDELALQDTSRELSGFLTGALSKGTDGLYVLIDGFVKAPPLEEKGGRLIFGAETLSTLKKEVASLGSEKRVLGWYHTHPGAHLTLSAQDESIAEAYFRYPWQVTYLIDPLRKNRNFYSWKDSLLAPRAGFRIYGKKEKEKEVRMEEKSQPKGDDFMKEKFFERHFENLQKLVNDPPLMGRHLSVLVMLAIIIVLQLAILLKSPAFNANAVASSQREILQRLKKIEARLELMGSAAPAPVASATASPEAPPPSPPPSETPAPTAPPPAESPAATAAPATPPAETPPAEAPSPAETTPAATVTPAPSPVEPPAAKPAIQTHVVKKGETLSIICKTYYGTMDPTVIKWLSHINNLQKPERLKPGMTIKLPPRKK